MLNKIKSLNQELDDKTKRNIEILDNFKSFKEKKISLQNSIDEIHSSENFKKYIDLQNKLNEFSNQKSKIKSEIDTQFTKISRPLSRYEYGSSLDKEQKNILSTLVANPIDAIIPKNKDSIIMILENVRKGISSNSISVKDIDKSLSYITEIEEALEGFVNRISEYLEKYEKMKNDLNSLNSDELVSLEQELIKNTSLKEDLQLKSETFSGEVDEIYSKVPQLVSEIEEKLREFSNTKYSIISS